MHWIRRIVLVAGILYAGMLPAQQIPVDSVMNLIATRPDDTTKVIHYRIVTGLLRLTKPSEGIAYGLKGAQLGKSLHFDKGTAGCYLNVSACYNNLGKLDSALIAIDSAIVYSHRAGDPNRLALVYLNRADYEMQLQRFDDALRDCDTSMIYAEKANSDDRRARILQTIGSIYLFQENYPRTIEYYFRADSLYLQTGNLLMSAIVQNNLALVYKNTGEYQKAVDVTHKAIAIADSLNELSNMSMYHGTLSDAYFHMDELALAEKHANLSMDYAIQLNNDLSKAEAWQSKGQIYIRQQQFAKGIEAFTNAYDIAVTMKDLTKMESTSGDLASAYAAAGNYAQAYKFLSIHADAADSLAHRRYDEEIASMQTRFQVNEKDKEIQLLSKDSIIQQARLSRQRVLFLSSIGLIVLGVIGISLYISRYRLRNRMKELELRQRIAADLHDEVGSSLSSIHMLSQIATQQDAPNGQEILHRMSRNARETMDKMSDIVWMIKPGESEGITLKQRIEQFAYELASTQGIEVNTDLSMLEKEKLNMEQRRNIYLIFREAINNALKYSGTDKLDIMATAKDGNLNLLIRDYGSGMNLQGLRKGNGLGNMEKRAKEIGGKLVIDSSPGLGTSVSLTAPA